MSGNRSETTYTKINTIFKRDINNIIMPFDKLTLPEFEYLRNCKWHCEEKIDGTNIRIEITSETDWDLEDENEDVKGVFFNVNYKGKSDNADVPKDLIDYLKDKFPAEKVLNAFNYKPYIKREEFETYGIKPTALAPIVPKTIVIYGEGYGAGIQSGGYYRKDKAFIMFDVAIDKHYMSIDARNDICTKIGADLVPFMGDMTIEEAIEYVKRGFKSVIAEEDHNAEGLVLRPLVDLYGKRGNRIITKIKTCDFSDYFRKYETYEKVEQIPNPKAKAE